MTLRARLIQLARHFPENGVKLLLENPLNDRDLFEIQGDDLFRDIDMTQLKLERTTFVQRDYRHIESDIVLTAPVLDKHGKSAGRPIIVYILIEHQSTPDPLIVFRELEYVIAICKRQLRDAIRQRRNLARFRFQPVLPIIFYTGTQRWDRPPRLVELFLGGTLFRKVIPIFNPLFLNLRDTPVETLRRGGALGSVLELLSRRDAGNDEFAALLDRCVRQLEELSRKDRARWLELLSYIQAMVYHMRDPGEQPKLLEMIELSVQTDPERREIHDMGKTMAQVLDERGQRKGEKRGELRARRNILLRQLRAGFGELPTEVVRRIQRSKDLAQLDGWLDNVPKAKSLSDVGVEDAG